MSNDAIISLIFSGINDTISIASVSTFVDQLAGPTEKVFLLNSRSSIYLSIYRT